MHQDEHIFANFANGKLSFNEHIAETEVKQHRRRRM